MKRLIRHFLHSHSQLAQFLRFATVGVKISAIDAGGVYLLSWVFGMNLYASRVISLATAILAGYLLNRYFTFGGFEQGSFYRQMAGHFGVHLLGGLVNYGIYGAIITIGHKVLVNKLVLAFLPLIGIWIGGMVGLGFNFLVTKKLVWNTDIRKADTSS